MNIRSSFPYILSASVVFPSKVFKFEAATEASSTVIVNACPDSVIPSRVAIAVSVIDAVNIPVVYPERVFALATEIVPDAVIASSPKPAIVPAPLAV